MASDGKQLLKEVAALVCSAFDVDAVHVYMRDAEQDHWTLHISVTPQEGVLPTPLSQRDGAAQALIRHVGHTGLTTFGAEVGVDAQPAADMSSGKTMALPLMSHGEVIGVFVLWRDQSPPLDPEAQALLEPIVSLLANSLQALRFREESNRRTRQIELLHQTTLDIANDLDLDRILSALISRAMSLTGTDCGIVALMDQNSGELIIYMSRHPSASLTGRRYKRGEGLIGRVWLQGRSLLVEDLSQWASRSPTLDHVEMHTTLGVPLKWSSEVVGVLVVAHAHDAHATIDTDSVSMVEKLAQQAAIAVHHTTLYEELTERATARALQRDQLAQLYQGLAEIARTDDIQSVLHLMASFIQRSGWRRVNVTLRDRSLNVTHMATAGFTDAELRELMNNIAPGDVWQERLGPDFDRWRTGDWYYLPGQDPVVQQLGIRGVSSSQRYDGPDHSWHTDDVLYMPLHDRAGRPIGLVIMDDPIDGQAPTTESMNPLQLFVRNAALMLENRRLNAERERQLATTLTLQETAALVSSTLDLGQIFNRVVSILVERFGYPLIAIYLMKGGELHLQVAHGFDAVGLASHIPAGRGVLGRAVATRRVMFLENVARDPDYVELVSGVTAEIVVPLVGGEDVLGVINVESTAERPLNFEDRDLLAVLGEQITTAVYNAQLFGETQRHALMLEAATEVSRRVSSILDIDRLLGEVVELIQRSFGYDHVHIYLREEDYNRGEPNWILREGTGDVGMQLRAQGHRYHGVEGVVGMAGTLVQAVLIPDILFDPTIPPNPLLPETRAELAVPLKLGRSVLGVLDVRSHIPNGLTAQDQSLLETLANQIGIAVHNAQLFAATESQLVERESLYRASHHISSATSVEDVLEGIFDTMRVTHSFIEGAGALLTGPPTDEYIPSWVEVAAIWTRNSLETDPKTAPLLHPGVRYTRERLPAMTLLRGNRTIVFDDILHATALDIQAQLVFGSRRGMRSAALVPLGSGHRLIGWLLLLSRQPSAFSPSVLQPYETLADQAALAIERSRLLDQTQQRATRLAALNEIAGRITATLELKHILHESVVAFSNFFGVSQSGLVLFDRQGEWGEVVARYSDNAVNTPDLPTRIPLRDNPLIDVLFETREPVEIYDATIDPLTEPIRDVVMAYGYQSILIVPLIVRDTVIGSVSLDIVGGHRRFEPEEIKLAQTIAHQIAVAIQNAQLYAEARTRLNETRTLYLAGRDITAARTQPEVLQAVLANLIGRTSPVPQETLDSAPQTLDEGEAAPVALGASADRIVITLFGPVDALKPKWLEVATGWNRQRSQPVNTDQHYQVERMIPALQPTGIPFTLNEIDLSTVDEETRALFGDLGTQAVAGIPLRAGGIQRGWLLVEYVEPHRWTEEELRPLQTLADQAAVAMENQQLLAHAQQAAREEAAFRSVLEAIAGANDEGEAFRALASTAISLLGMPVCIAAGWEASEDEWHVNAAVGSQQVLPAEPGMLFLSEDQRLSLRAGSLLDIDRQDPHLPAELAAEMDQYGATTLWRIPLRIRGDLIAILDLLSPTPHRLEGDERRLARTLAQQCATALDSLRLFQQTERRASRLAAINQVSTTITQTMHFQDLLMTGIREIVHALNVPQAGIVLIDHDAGVGRLVLEYAAGQAAMTGGDVIVSLDNYPAMEEVMVTRRPLIVNDVISDPLVAPARDLMLSRNVRSIVLVPMVVRDEVIGTIGLDSVDVPRRWTRDEIDLAQTMTNQLATAVQNARFFEEVQNRANQLEAVSEVSRRLSSILELDRLLYQVVTVIRDRFGYYHVHIFLRDEEDAKLMVVREGAGDIGRALKEMRHALPFGSGVVGTAAATGEINIANNVMESPEYRPNPLLPHTRAEIALPLKIGNEVIGVLDVQSTEAYCFGSTERAILGALADQIAIAVNNALLYLEQERAVKQLQEVDRLKSEFLASMSHELRTPLNSIIGFSKVILKGIDGPLTDMQRQDITSIFNSGQHLLSLINDILDLSKIAAGKMDLHPERLPLRMVLDEAMRTSEALVKEKPIKLECDLRDDLPSIWADRTRIKQIILNLMSNAIKFTEQGHVRVSVKRVSAIQPALALGDRYIDQNGPYVEIQVSDTGIGIKLEDQGIVFEEFRQVDGSSTRRAGGTGLGLAISRRLVEMHGGTIWVESEGITGKGSIFRFTIPVADVPRDTHESVGNGKSASFG